MPMTDTERGSRGNPADRPSLYRRNHPMGKPAGVRSGLHREAVTMTAVALVYYGIVLLVFCGLVAVADMLYDRKESRGR